MLEPISLREASLPADSARLQVPNAVPPTTHAQRLYARMGFEETAPFYDGAVPGTCFLALTLRPLRHRV